MSTVMTFRESYKQAFREARANGRIGYSLLRNPRARMAATETLRMRLDRDGLTKFRYEFAAHPGWLRNKESE
jgi:predicted acetyltransferase